MTDDQSNGAAVRVAFQGEPGAYSDEAVRRYFGHAAEPVACRDFDAVGARTIAGEADYGLLPIENTLAGSVVASYDVLASPDLGVVGEIISPIHHCVLALPGAPLDGVARVLSHPVALAQCRRWIAAHPRIEAVSWYDTAGAAREVASRGDPAAAAIASRLAAERYGLVIIDHDVEDRPDNQTRFLLVARTDAPLPRPAADASAAYRTSLLAETANAPGALLRLLQPFAERGVNLTKLESRPAGQPWSYRFFLDVDGAAGASPLREALDHARRAAQSLRVLGSYPRWQP
ncbi:MAG TPA: prephenate dehydratase [Longimicrobium sp.]|nr:prephenate dehydratase [Longimicrobium sp.]